MNTLTGTDNRITAVFDDRTQAERAVQALRNLGISDDQLSFVAQNDIQPGYSNASSTDRDAIAAAHDVDEDEHPAGERVGKGLAAGAGVGALFGLAALAIPGVGPFITAGFLTHALGAAGGALVAGAVVGGTSGAVAGAFAKAGYTEHEAKYYGDAIERGGIVVAVDTNNYTQNTDEIRRTLSEYGGRYAE